MRVCSIVSFLAMALVSSSARADSPSYRVNGWYPCARSTVTIEDDVKFDEAAVFQCADLEVPLCYDGVCDSDKMINIFVKRRLANPQETTSTASKAMILMAGGPGNPSRHLEGRMIDLLDTLDGTTDFYTFDHRGTGRSEFLNCEAAQAMTVGSDNGKFVTAEEITHCIQDLNFQYGGQAAAFSVTSAAMDVRAIIETFMADQDVYVAGYSYGTYLLQRVLQLQIPQVIGYIFDSVAKTFNSHWNEGILTSSRRLLEYCYDDDACPLSLESRETVIDDVLALYDTLDTANATHPGAHVLLEKTPGVLPSRTIRSIISGMVGKVGKRVEALQILSYLQDPTPEAIRKLRELLGLDGSDNSSKTGDVSASHHSSRRLAKGVDVVADDNSLLKNVITFSERWRQPPPTAKELAAMYKAGPFSIGVRLIMYCAFTGATDEACSPYAETFKNQSFFYERDEYVGAPLVVPDHASVLIFAGGLDMSTPMEYGALLFSNLEGGAGKLLVNFDYGTHCNGEATETQSKKPCHYALIGSFINNDGDVLAMDTSCMETLPRISFENM